MVLLYDCVPADIDLPIAFDKQNEAEYPLISHNAFPLAAVAETRAFHAHLFAAFLKSFSLPVSPLFHLSFFPQHIENSYKL